jgi:hypothetical protein
LRDLVTESQGYMAKIISEYSELLAAIEGLPKSPAGTVRVFRGQTRDYPNLYPSGLRRSPRLLSIWRVYAAHLYSALKPAADDGMSIEDLQAHSLWFSALAQQYGPGSDFLDVSYSIDVAVWFALNKTKIVTARGAIGPDGPLDPVLDHPTFSELVGYEPWEDKQGGCIYVLDLPLWNGQGLARPGEVVDLAKAPEIFASSPRMIAQSGCLIYCRKDDRSPFDVRPLLVQGTPLQVRRPMMGTTAHDRSVADIYPSPSQDAWYARFLSVPMTYSAQPAPPMLRRSIPVVVYYDRGNERYRNEVHFHDIAIQPPLVHRIEPELLSPAANQLPPTIILIEAPMVFPSAPADSDQWHHGLLWDDVPERCSEYRFGEDQPVGGLPLGDVFFEFSPLEGIGWERAIHDNVSIELTRAVWLRRSGSTLELAIFLQEAPAGGVQRASFLSLFYDPSTGRIMISLPNGTVTGLDALGHLAKPVIIALMVLRNLSPVLKAQPIPTFVADRTTMVVGVARDAARLYRVRALPPNPDWFVLRDAGNPDEPFCYATQEAGYLTVTSEVPFRDVPLATLRESLAAYAN